MNPIPYGKQHITQDDIDAVIRSLRSEFLTQGPAVQQFENAFASYIGSQYAVAISNGTAALHLCAMALDVKEGDKIISSPITFAASSNCVRYCGGDVVFADIDPETYLIDIEAVRKLLQASPNGTYKGLIPVDFAGRSVDMPAFKKLADEYGLWIIEDACHAPGGYYAEAGKKKYHCGDGSLAELSIFSFHPVKHIASGEGGMITTNNKALYEKLLLLRTHGITRNEKSFRNDIAWAAGNATEKPVEGSAFPGWYMEMQELGYNYRLTDFQAALGTSQLKRADEGLTRRKEIAKKYNEAFAGRAFIKGQSGFVNGHAYHLYIVEVDNRLGLYTHLRTKNIFAQVHYIPTHLMPYYRQLGWNEGDMPHAETYYSRCLSLPMYPTLTAEEQQFVIDTILNFYE